MKRTLLITGLVLLLMVSSGCVGEEKPKETTDQYTKFEENIFLLG